MNFEFGKTFIILLSILPFPKFLSALAFYRAIAIPFSSNTIYISVSLTSAVVPLLIRCFDENKHILYGIYSVCTQRIKLSSLYWLIQTINGANNTLLAKASHMTWNLARERRFEIPISAPDTRLVFFLPPRVNEADVIRQDPPPSFAKSKSKSIHLFSRNMARSRTTKPNGCGGGKRSGAGGVPQYSLKEEEEEEEEDGKKKEKHKHTCRGWKEDDRHGVTISHRQTTPLPSPTSQETRLKQTLADPYHETPFYTVMYQVLGMGFGFPSFLSIPFPPSFPPLPIPHIPQKRRWGKRLQTIATQPASLNADMRPTNPPRGSRLFPSEEETRLYDGLLLIRDAGHRHGHREEQTGLGKKAEDGSWGSNWFWFWLFENLCCCCRPYRMQSCRGMMEMGTRGSRCAGMENESRGFNVSLVGSPCFWSLSRVDYTEMFARYR